MTRRAPLHRRLDPARRFLREEAGAGLVEYALVILLFLTLLFGIIDFGRLGFAVVSANKANQIAARIAAVRPPACEGDFGRFGRVNNSSATFGTLCRPSPGSTESVCLQRTEVTCLGNAANDTAAEVFAAVRPLMPPNTGIDDIRFRYTPDRNLGFLGGPYVPMVPVEFAEVDFNFVVPLWGNALGITLPNMSVSLPGEDLCQGEGAGCN
jgi:Flp pilus assembly protein TadG